MCERERDGGSRERECFVRSFTHVCACVCVCGSVFELKHHRVNFYAMVCCYRFTFSVNKCRTNRPIWYDTSAFFYTTGCCCQHSQSSTSPRRGQVALRWRMPPCHTSSPSRRIATRESATATTTLRRSETGELVRLNRRVSSRWNQLEASSHHATLRRHRSPTRPMPPSTPTKPRTHSLNRATLRLEVDLLTPSRHRPMAARWIRHRLMYYMRYLTRQSWQGYPSTHKGNNNIWAIKKNSS